MRILRVQIENWRSIHRLALDFEQSITIVQGPNETGKSTVQEAIRHAFLAEAGSTASELKELVPWGSSAKAHVELTFETKAGERFRIVKSFPKGEARLYTGEEALLAEGRGVQEKIFTCLGVPSDAADLFRLLWIDQGAGLELFGKRRDGGPLTGPAQTLVKSIIKENMLSERAEELLRDLQKERTAILQQNGRPKKASRLGELEQREGELAREAGELAEEVEEAEQRGEELEGIEAGIAELSAGHERETALLAALERKHDKARELEPKEQELARLEESHARLLSVEAKERESAAELPGLITRKLQSLEAWIAALDERREAAQELHDRLEEVEAKLAQARVTERSLLDELEGAQRRIGESRVRLEASKLTLRVTPVKGGSQSLGLSRDEGAEELVTLSQPEEWSAMRSIGLSIDETLDLECFGPLSREDWETLTKKIAEEEARFSRRLEEVGCESLEAAKKAFDAYGALLAEKARVDRELAAFMGPGGSGLERETAEAKAAQEEAAREVELVARLGVVLESGEATADAGNPPTDVRPGHEKERASSGAAEQLRRLSSRVSVVIRDLEESRRGREEILGGRTREDLAHDLFTLKEELEHARSAVAAMEPVEAAEVSAADLKAKRLDVEAVAADLAQAKERRTALSALQSRSAGSLERKEELERELLQLRASLEEERTRVKGVELLIRLIEEEKEELDRNIVAPLEERLTEAFRALSGARYASVALGEDFGVGSIEAGAVQGSVAVDVRSLSYGTREQLSFLFRLLVAQYLSSREPQVMMLDDSFVNTDSLRRERLFEMMSDDTKGLQFLLFTCHAEHYESYRGRSGVAVIEMAAARE